MSLQVVNRTEFDLPTVKLVRSVLYAECSLPCSATLRTPLQVIFQRISFTNFTNKLNIRKLTLLPHVAP